MKTKLFILLGASALLVTGCESEETKEKEVEEKTLSCSAVNPDGMEGVESIIEAKYEGDEMVNHIITTNVDLGVEVEVTDEELSEDCAEYAGIEGVTCDVSISGTIYTLSLDYDLTKTTDEFLDEDGFTKENYSDYKKGLEDASYTCK